MGNDQKLVQAKQELRRKMLLKLKTQKEEERTERSRKIRKKLFSLSAFKQAQVIMFYISCGFEVDTLNMIKEAIKLGKKVAVPRLKDNNRKMAISLVSGVDSELEIGPYGIKQPKAEYLRPVSIEKIDLIVVPGVAFSSGGKRLGRGKGYYDRLLETKREKTRTVGLAFKCQIVEDLPQSPHDYPVEQVISA
ncbi:MAG: 5-formyltetrahydrofolate cyclo-ligase [Candidatus Omnitrophota bacterium]|nr:5-formyltetrahydrofolate cyclo-ligase [Candidatus Omnitrophota bacterium]